MGAPYYASASPERLYKNQPPTTETTLYTVPSTLNGVNVQRVVVNQVVLCNNTSSPSTINLSIVPSGGTAANYRTLGGTSIPANSTQTLDLSEPMYVGDFISGYQGTSGSITLTVSGTVMS